MPSQNSPKQISPTSNSKNERKKLGYLLGGLSGLLLFVSCNFLLYFCLYGMDSFHLSYSGTWAFPYIIICLSIFLILSLISILIIRKFFKSNLWILCGLQFFTVGVYLVFFLYHSPLLDFIFLR